MMGLLEPITHREEIERTINEAQQIYDAALNSFQEQKKATSQSLEALGKLKINVWSTTMNSFIDTFRSFKNLEVSQLKAEKYFFAGQDENPEQILFNIKKMTAVSQEYFKKGAVTLGTSVLIGIASCGGTLALKNLSSESSLLSFGGSEKRIATMNWLGSSDDNDGVGAAKGAAVLAGVALVTISAIALIIKSAQAKEQLAEAKKAYAEAEDGAAKMRVVEAEMHHIQKASDAFASLIENVQDEIIPFIRELNEVKKDYSADYNGMIDFDDLSDVEKKTLHLAWLLGELLYRILNISLLSDDGEIPREAENALSSGENCLSDLNQKADHLNQEKKEISLLLNGSKNILEDSQDKLDKKRRESFSILSNLFKKKIKYWADDFFEYGNALSSFQNIDCSVGDRFYTINDDRQILTDVLTIPSFAKRYVSLETGETDSGMRMELAALGNPQAITDDSFTTEYHDASKWLSGVNREINSIAGIPKEEIERTIAIVQSITKKENLVVARNIYSQATEMANTISKVTNDLKEIDHVVKCEESILKKVHNLFRPFPNELKRIIASHSEASSLDYDLLDPSEKRIIDLSWEIARVYHSVISMPVIDCDGAIVENIYQPLDYAKRTLRRIKKRAFIDDGYKKQANNLIWKPYSFLMMALSFVAIFCYAVVGISVLVSGSIKGLLFFLAIVIAFPIFFKFKDIAESKKLIIRTARLLASLICVVIASII